MVGGYLIKQVHGDRVDAVLAFYDMNVGEYLWPRKRHELESLARAECLFEAVEADGGQVVATVYTRAEEGSSGAVVRWELGGLFAVKECRGNGIASALCRLAIATLYVQLSPTEPLIGHVHEENGDPRLLLEKLGFVDTGRSESPPDDQAPPNMPRNADGKVVGKLYQYDVSKLADLAEWLEAFRGSLKSGQVLEIDLPILKLDVVAAVRALRELAVELSSR